MSWLARWVFFVDVAAHKVMPGGLWTSRPRLAAAHAGRARAGGDPVLGRQQRGPALLLSDPAWRGRRLPIRNPGLDRPPGLGRELGA